MEVESSSLFLVALLIFVAYHFLTRWLEKRRNTIVIKGVLTLSLFITLLFLWFKNPLDHGEWNIAFVSALSIGFLYSMVVLFKKWRQFGKPFAT